MAVFRVERTRDYTVMCNHHLKDSGLSLKAKGLLSMMLSLPDEWNYTTRGLAAICKEGVDAIGKTLKELELAGYIIRRQLRGKDGRISDTEYTIFEKPRKPSPPDTTLPDTENPYLDNPDTEAPDTDNPAQLNTKKSNHIADDDFQMLSVLFVQRQQKCREHGEDHKQGGGGVPQRLFREKEQRDTHKQSGTEAHQLPFCQVEQHLGFDLC